MVPVPCAAKKTIRVAVFQSRTQPTTLETIQLIKSTAQDAASKSVDLILFPEAFLGGYPRTADFGTSIGARQDYGREQFLRYYQDAVDLGDTPKGAGIDWLERNLPTPKGSEYRGDGTREQLEQISKETGVFLVIGIVERCASALYCTSVFVDSKQGVMAKRRKVMPTGSERLVWSQGGTDTLKAVTVHLNGIPVTLGSAICWENYMPLLRYSLYAQNVNIWLAPTADGRDTWLPLLKTIACEGRTFVLSCNQVLERKHLPNWVQNSENLPSDGANPVPNSNANVSPRSHPTREHIISETKDGHEICWPMIENHGKKPEDSKLKDSTSKSRERRRSEVLNASKGIELCLPVVDNSWLSSLSNDGGHELSISNLDQNIPTSHSTKSHKKEFISRGGSCVVSPFGKLLQGPVWESEELLVTDIEIDDCIKGKLDFDVAGHYSRSDSFHLTVQGLDLSPP